MNKWMIWGVKTPISGNTQMHAKVGKPLAKLLHFVRISSYLSSDQKSWLVGLYRG